MRTGLLAAVADFLVEPAEPIAAGRDRARVMTARPVVAVAGLAPRSGTTTIARALAAELALRDPERAALVSADAVAGGGIPLGTPAAGRLCRAVSRSLVVQVRAVGRVCVVAGDPEQRAQLADFARDVAPLVLDVADPAETAAAAALVDALVLVGTPRAEPALAALMSESLARVGPHPLAVVNRDRGDAEAWDGRCAIRLPEARMGAQLALAGREARGTLGRAVAELADLIAVVS
jgi:hypothetical protein